MRPGSLLSSPFEDLFDRFLGSTASPAWTSGRWEVPTDVFQTEDGLIIRMELAGVNPDDVEVTSQENNLVINGTRRFPYDAEKVQFLRRGSFYGDFTQRVALGRGLALDRISARYDNGVLEVTVPFSDEIQPKRVQIEVGGGAKQLQS